MERISLKGRFSIVSEGSGDPLPLDILITDIAACQKLVEQGRVPVFQIFLNGLAASMGDKDRQTYTLAGMDVESGGSLMDWRCGLQFPDAMLINVQLPTKISMHVSVKTTSTVLMVLDMAQTKFRNLFGHEVTGTSAVLVLSGKEDLALEDSDCLKDIPYIHECLKDGTTPSFLFCPAHASVNQVHDIIGAYEDDMESLLRMQRQTLRKSRSVDLTEIIGIIDLKERLELMVTSLALLDRNQAVADRPVEQLRPSFWLDEVLMRNLPHRALDHLKSTNARKTLRWIHSAAPATVRCWIIKCDVVFGLEESTSAESALRQYLRHPDQATRVSLRMQGNSSAHHLKRKLSEQQGFPSLPLRIREYRLTYRHRAADEWVQTFDESATLDSLNVDREGGEILLVLLPRMKVPKGWHRSLRSFGASSHPDRDPQLALFQLKLLQLGKSIRAREFQNSMARDFSRSSWEQPHPESLLPNPANTTSVSSSTATSLLSLDIMDHQELPELHEHTLIIDDVVGPLAPNHFTMSVRLTGDMSRVSSWDVTNLFTIELMRCDNLAAGGRVFDSTFIECRLYHGIQALSTRLRTSSAPFSDSVRLDHRLSFDVAVYNLPRHARLAITLYGQRRKSDEPVPIGGLNLLLFDYQGNLIQGQRTISLNANETANAVGLCNVSRSDDSPNMQIRFPIYECSIVLPQMIRLPSYVNHIISPAFIPANVQRLLNRDALSPLTDEDRATIWHYRYAIAKRPQWLQKLVEAASWNSLQNVLELYGFIDELPDLERHQIIPVSLGLLGGRTVDARVRAWAVSQLNLLPDDELSKILLQLVQAVKYEPHCDSALARFLFVRAMCCKVTGQLLFWLLKSEMANVGVPTSFGCILSMILRLSGPLADDLEMQEEIVQCLSDICETTRRLSKAAARRQTMQTMVELRFEAILSRGPARLAVLPNHVIDGLVVEKWKTMDSKMAPLLCFFTTRNKQKPLLPILFKLGDDLRQDMLTLQMISMMDELWKSEGLDLKLTPYKCLQTGTKAGMIQVVEGRTVSSIQLDYGGSSAAFKEETISKWILSQCHSREEYLQAATMFTLSCAGYCVATYCLGIGDRHNGNIMVTDAGKLFHIDFGHFLGNIKRKFGIKRERAPFVLTPDFVYVIKSSGKENFERFCQICRKAYTILRRNADLLINGFAMMVCTGAPELTSYDDIEYLRDALSLGQSEREAEEKFQSLIHESIRLGWSTQLNWWVHNLVHK